MLKFVIKRTFDVLASLILLIILSPILVIVYFLVKNKLGTPALFVQERPGKFGKIFKMYKFRSMTEEKKDGNLLSDEHRLTDFGKLLRKTSLDELPELINVIKGDMSFVGPRPLLVQYLPRYSEKQARRHEVKPGITGWAQVNGRNAISWEEKFDLDVWYVDNWSLWLDLKIIIKTFIVIFKKSGINAEGKATMNEFIGSTGDDK